MQNIQFLDYRDNNENVTGCICGENKIIFDPHTKEVLCIKCGSIIGFDHTLMEEITVKENNKMISKSSRTSLDYSTLGIISSQIGRKNSDFAGKNIKDPQMFYRLRFLDKMCVNKNEPNRLHHIKTAKQTIISLSDKLGIPINVADRAARIYDTAYSKKLIKGRNIEGIAATTLFIACKESGIIKHLGDFAEIMLTKSVVVDEKTKLSSYKVVKNKRSIQKQLFEFYELLTNKLELNLTKTIDLPSEINRIAGMAKISQKSVRYAIDLIEKLKDYNKTIFYGKSPIAISVCVLYIATKYTGESVKQVVMTRSSNISTVTLRKRCSEYVQLLKKNKQEIPEQLNTFLT